MNSRLIIATALALLTTCSLSCVAIPTGAVFRATGGGYTDAGLAGDYFPNATFSGAPSFTRQDVRIDFDWGTVLPVGGSLTAPYASFPREQFSVRWSGRVIARFSETYTFVVTADDTVTIEIKPTNSAVWTELINCGAPTDGATGAYAFSAGIPYDLRIAYVQHTGAARVSLAWRSPSTPLEIIGPVTLQGVNANQYFQYTFANLTKRARWRFAYDVDDAGWARQDGEMTLADGVDNLQGTYLLQFNGKARVRATIGNAWFFNGTSWVTTLPSGTGYNPVDNVTRVLMTTAVVRANWIFGFYETQRNAAAPTNSGVSDIRFMRPLEPGSNVAHDASAIIYEPTRRVYRHYTCLRYNDTAMLDPVAGDWSRRTWPSHLAFKGAYGATNRGDCFEYLIMLANECGKDLYLCTPMQANDEYFTKLAQLLKYGSDGFEPYTTYQANPAYPPLNPNLHVYVEVGNEIWNWAFGSTQYAQRQGGLEVLSNTAVGAIMNFDGKCGTSGIIPTRRFHAIRSVHASDAFRAVFGDAAMGGRVRCVLEQQYDNKQNETYATYRFLESYYNNADGVHVATPHPVRYYFAGGGGAGYYGTGNSYGSQTNIVFADPEFALPIVADGTATPGTTGGVWHFTGNAGIYRNASLGVGTQTFGTVRTVSAPTVVGMKLRTGVTPLYLHELGRWYTAAHTGIHTVQLVRVSDKALLAQAHVTGPPNNARKAAIPTFRYARLLVNGLPSVLALETNTEYYLVTHERAGGDNYYRENTFVVPRTDLNIAGAMSATVNGAATNPTAWTITETVTPHLCYGPVAFRCTTNSALAYTRFPSPIYDEQAAFILSNGAISASLNFTTVGIFAVAFRAAGSGVGWPGHAAFDILFDNQRISPISQVDYRVTPSGAGIGGWSRHIDSLEETWGSSVFTVTNTGLHTIAFIGRAATTDNFLAIDYVGIDSLDAILSSGFGSGEALGQAVQANYEYLLNTEARYARAFGLETIAYESGISIGGDFWKRPIQAYCCFDDPRVRDMNNDAMDMFTRAGGSLNIWGVYSYWPNYDFVGADARPLVRSIVDMANRLPVEASNGLPIPATLTTNTLIKFYYTGADSKLILTNRGDWAGWLVVCPKTARYAVRVNASAGGVLDVEADGITIGSGDSSAIAATPFKVFLTKDQHGIRVRNVGGACIISNVLVYEDESADPPEFAPAPGTYPTTLSVTISTATAGATIRYTTDGSTPSTNHGTIYAAPVPVAADLTLAALAYKTSIADSDIVSGRYFISTLAIITDTLPLGTVGLAYAAALAAGGGTPPYTWDRAGGSLPAGLALVGNGVVQGTPTMVGISTFNARVKDSIGASVTRPLDITVIPEPALPIAAASLVFSVRRLCRS